MFGFIKRKCTAETLGTIYYLTQEQYDDAVIGGKVRISLKGK